VSENCIICVGISSGKFKSNVSKTLADVTRALGRFKYKMCMEKNTDVVAYIPIVSLCMVNFSGLQHDKKNDGELLLAKLGDLVSKNVQVTYYIGT